MRVMLEEKRRERDLTQAELAKLSGVTQPIISEIERGIIKDPRLSTLNRLAAAFECKVDDLLEDKKEEGA